MKKTLHIFFILLLLSFSIQNPKTIATYKRSIKNAPENGIIYLRNNGTFLTQFFGGCDGTLETQGKWKINKDTITFTEIETRMMNDPWKKTNRDCKYLMKKQTLTAFSIVDNKVVLDSNEIYKKVKNK
ncbi:MAG: hypothetical protein Q8L81_05075 [Bacteroidota bacterium]|nr:hypothetical protein [Bacteroidota bacterium]